MFPLDLVLVHIYIYTYIIVLYYIILLYYYISFIEQSSGSVKYNAMLRD